MLSVEKQSDAELMNNGFYSPDKTLAQPEWEQMTGSLWTSISIYLFQISQDLDLVIPPRDSGGFLSLFTKLLHSQEMEVLTGHIVLNVTDSKDYSLGYNMEPKRGWESELT